MNTAKKEKREWAIKLEDLNITEKYADQIETVLYNFLNDDIGYMITEWIQPIMCRSYSGFSPYSTNKGGYQAYTYRSQLDFYFQPTGFEIFDKVCENTYNYVIENGLEGRGISVEDYNKGIENDDNEMISIRDVMEESYNEYDEACFETMLKLESEDTLFVSFMLKGSDAPYFRGYDDCIDFEVKFNNILELKIELNKILDDSRVQDFISIMTY